MGTTIVAADVNNQQGSTLIQAIDHTEASVATRIVAIQRAAYAVEAELMGFDGIPPLHELVTEVQAREDLTWLAAFIDDTMVGVVAWLDHGDSIEIDRLAVDPDWSRHGYGRRLVRAVPHANVINVSTGSLNYPAVTLYESEGYAPVSTTQVAPGVFTSQFQRRRGAVNPTNDTSRTPSEPSASAASRIAIDVFGEEPQSCERFTTGLRHWVYDVVLESGRKVVIRLSHPDHRDELRGGVFWHDKLRQAGVAVPAVIAHDLERAQPFMILERAPGTDLGNIFDQLSEAQLRCIAATVMEMQERTSLLPRAEGYGYALNYESPLHPSWHAVLEISVERSARAIQQVGAVDPAWAHRVRDKLAVSEPLLDNIEPIAFLHDATTKNVIVSGGKVSGLVDVDQMAFGDPLWTYRANADVTAQRPKTSRLH